MLKVRVFVPSKGRAETITTPAVLDALGQRCTVVVHSDDEAERYRRAGRAGDSLVISGVPGDAFGLTRQREFICEVLAVPGEWFLFADDNIMKITAVPMPYYREGIPALTSAQQHELFGAEIDSALWGTVLQETVDAATRVGAHIAGFGATSNPRHRMQKWAQVCYVRGKMFLWHNVPYGWDHTISMEDFRNTAEHLLRYGTVLVHKWCRAEARHYMPGGMGTKAERCEQRQRDCRALMRLYPGLFRLKPQATRRGEWDLRLNIHSIEGIAAWRRRLLTDV